ncbi:hypothetical protein [Actinacidiphila sp. bgisy160]|uniref:hypothetical protein n=1 Tax=Actinacidiphila sp. bgisy160 TaxID=3413796 RepID=UPI003D703F8D
MNAEPEPEDEWELSVLLERAVPRPPAPHDRMAQVRRLVRRRRRRRVAAGAVAAVGGVTAAVMAAALLQPANPVTPRGQRILPAASPSRSVPAPGYPLPGPTRSTDPGYELVGVDGLSGLRLKMRGENWRSFTTSGPRGLVVGFVGSGPLHERGECTKPEIISYSVCPPVDKVAEEGVLISFRQVEAPGGSGDRPGRFMVKGVVAAGEGCRALGGQWELTGWGEDPDATSSVGLLVSACFNRPAKGTVDAVTASLRTATFAAPFSGGPVSPGTPG